jgi:hypothetical protein
MRKLFDPVLAALLVATVAIGQDNPPKQEVTAAKTVSTNTITGRCHCGSIVYEASAAHAGPADCTCRGCQRASGALKPEYVNVPAADLKITAGQPSVFKAKPEKVAGAECDAWGVWEFCPKCGGPLFWRSDDGKKIAIFAGTLDDPRVYKPKK